MGKLNRDEIRYALDEDVELKAELIGSTDTVTPEEKRMDDIHCADLDAEMDAERETARFGGEYEFYEDANEYGFPQMYQRGDSRIPGDEKDSPVCPQCHAPTMPNRGNGMLCSDCHHSYMVECDHNYVDGLF